MAASPKVDLLTNRVTDATGTGGCNTQSVGYSRTSDADGRVATLASNTTWWQLGFGYSSPTAFQAGLESVYQSVTTPGGTFQYFYDATNHRRAKQYPTGAVVETFYDLGGNVLSVRAPNALTAATETTVEDSIWLAGRLVAQVRGRFNSALTTRLAEPSQSCVVLGESARCGIFHVINDYLPKPILVIEAATELVTGAALYDEWGYINRVPLVAGVATSAGVATIGSATLPQGGTLQARALYGRVDLGGTTMALLNGAVGQGGVQKAHVWSGWTSSTTTATVTTSAGWSTGTGVQTEAIEYRRYATTATPYFPNLRFPGQYYDPETELHENWNRFYDPSGGRYCSSEPLAQARAFIASLSSLGLNTPIFLYGSGNPTRYADENGLYFRNVDTAAATDIAFLASDPNIGADIARMAVDPIHAFDIHKKSSKEVDDRTKKRGGGRCKRETETSHVITYSPEYYNELHPLGVSDRPLTDTQLLAHELGEAFGQAYGGDGHEIGKAFEQVVP
jgi:RHS repeat-associated protein